MIYWGNREGLDLIGPLDGDNSLEDILGRISVSNEDDATTPDSDTRALLKRTWWQRMWVIQELALARETVFHCGTKRVGIEQLAAALTVFRLYHIAKMGVLHEAPYNYVPLYIDLHPFKILSMRRSELLDFSVDKMPLMIHLQNFCPYSRAGKRMNATDPRDHIFALLGISNSQHLGLLADYSKPCWQVYIELVKAHLGYIGSILSVCQFPKLQNDLPSWVPDWSSCSTGRELPLGFEHGTDKLILANVLPQFEAAKDLAPPERLEQNHFKILRLHGILVDIVDGFMGNDERFQFFAWYDSSIMVENAGKSFGLLLKPGAILTDQMIKDEIAKRLQVDEVDKEFGYFDRVTLKHGGSTGDYASERISFRKIEQCLDLARFVTDSVRSLASTCANIYDTPSLREEAIWRILIADQEVDKDDIWHRPAKAHYYVTTLERLVRYNHETYEDTQDFRMTARTQRAYDKLKEWDIVEDLNIEFVRKVVYGKETDQFGFVLKTAELIPKAFTLGCMKDLGISLEQYEQAAEKGEHPYDEADLHRRVAIKLQQVFEDLETDDPVGTLLENMKVAQEYLNLVRVQLLGRTVFVCKNGYLGLGPQHVQTGDIVAVVDGSPVPIVLRPIKDGCYQLVGESYVHGIMDGEAVGNGDIVVLEIK